MLKSKGFTLIELVVVMAIIAVLTVVAIPLYNDMLSRAQYSQLLASAKIYQRAAQAAIVDLGLPNETIVWGDSEPEQGEWLETSWVNDRIENGILVTISHTGDVEISFLEESENYDRYVELVEKFGDIT